MLMIMPESRVERWLGSLEERHLADLTPSEVGRALRALSSCYVERRRKLESGGALDTAGKRAAFALFYAPLHFVVTREVVRRLAGAADPLASLVDAGCGTGSAGAAWAIEAGAKRIIGIDRNPWAVSEANLTYRAFELPGRARQADVRREKIDARRGDGILAAYIVNELPDDTRATLLAMLIAAHARGARVLVIEPIARPGAWWSEWAHAFARDGGRADEWRFPSALPPRQRALAKAAGLDPRELTARSLWLPGGR
jgi:SAM-dependent methyltransferase